MVRTIRSCALLVSCLGITGCLTSGVDLEASAAWFAPTISGDVSLASSGGGALDQVDFDADLDLEDVDQAVMVQGRAGLLGLNVIANGFQTEQSGRGTLSADFGDITLGTPVSTDFELRAGQLALTYNLVDLAGVRVAPGLGVEVLDLTLDVRDPLTGTTEEIEGAAPIPMVFLDAEVSVPVVPVDVQVVLGGITGNYGDFDGTLLDGLAQVRWDAGAGVQVFGGYRMLRFDLEGTEDGQDYEADFDLDGWFLGAGIRF